MGTHPGSGAWPSSRSPPTSPGSNGGTGPRARRPFTVGGLSRGGTNIANSIAFITTDDFAARRGPALAYVLAGAHPGVVRQPAAAAPHRRRPARMTVQTQSRVRPQEAALVNDMTADLMRIMSIIGLLIALAVIGLTLFTLTLAKLREHAVVKALGGRPAPRGVVLAQAAWSVALAVAAATGLPRGWATCQAGKPGRRHRHRARQRRVGLGALGRRGVGRHRAFPPGRRRRSRIRLPEGRHDTLSVRDLTKTYGQGTSPCTPSARRSGHRPGEVVLIMDHPAAARPPCC